MGVIEESISKFSVGNRFHVKLRILSPYANRIYFLSKIKFFLHPINNLLMDSLLTPIVESRPTYLSFIHSFRRTLEFDSRKVGSTKHTQLKFQKTNLPCPRWVCGVIKRQKFATRISKQSLCHFWMRIRNECPVISDLAIHRILLFSTTYLCEAALSKL